MKPNYTLSDITRITGSPGWRKTINLIFGGRIRGIGLRIVANLG
jgi:hypothetical protein